MELASAEQKHEVQEGRIASLEIELARFTKLYKGAKQRLECCEREKASLQRGNAKQAQDIHTLKKRFHATFRRTADEDLAATGKTAVAEGKRVTFRRG